MKDLRVRKAGNGFWYGNIFEQMERYTFIKNHLEAWARTPSDILPALTSFFFAQRIMAEETAVRAGDAGVRENTSIDAIDEMKPRKLSAVGQQLDTSRCWNH